MKQQTKLLLIVAGCIAATSIFTHAKHPHKKPIEEIEEIEEIIYRHNNEGSYGFLSENNPPHHKKY